MQQNNYYVKIGLVYKKIKKKNKLMCNNLLNIKYIHFLYKTHHINDCIDVIKFILVIFNIFIYKLLDSDHELFILVK